MSEEVDSLKQKMELILLTAQDLAKRDIQHVSLSAKRIITIIQRVIEDNYYDG